MTMRLDDGTTGAWLGAAVAAPSIHNTQPWHFHLHDGAIDVRVDPARRLRIIDRYHRSMLLSVGAAAFNLRLAMALDGRLPVLRSFQPDGLTVARVEPGRPGRPGLRALGTALFQRHTNRGPYARAVVPAAVIDELRAAAAVEGAELTVLDRVRREVLLALIATADAVQRVIVGVDGSHNADPALGVAFEQAAFRATGLTAVRPVNACQWQVAGQRDGVSSPIYGEQDALAGARRVLAETVAGWQEKYPEVDVRFDVVTGRGGGVLADASAGAELLVVSARGHGGFTGLLLGSVSQAAVHHAHCPVVVVRQPS